MKSPLIIGTDVRRMTPATLSIYSNPAVLAVSQDPLGSAAYRVWKRPAALDAYNQGEISLWTGKLTGGDYIVALVNAGNVSHVLNAPLTDIFFDKSSTGSKGPAAEIMQTWEVYDLWANRLDHQAALGILSGNVTSNDTLTSAGGNSTSGHNATQTSRYNSTELSYADGLEAGHAALLGAKIGSITPRGTLSAHVPRHGIGLFRIRSSDTGAKKRDEL